MGALAGRREVRQWAPEPPIPPYPGAQVTFGSPSVANQPDQALVVPAVWACVLLLANTVSMMPLQTYRRTDQVPKRITDPALVSTPSDGMTQSEWLHMLMVSLLLRGNAYGLKDDPARPSQIALLNPDKVQVDIDSETGNVRYYLLPTRTEVTARMHHVRGLTLPGAVVGLSPIAYAAMSIGVDLSSRKFAKDFFDGGGVPKATLTSTLDLTQEQATIAKERLKAATSNREPAVFGNGITYTPISVRPEESQFLETQQANISEIARFFGVPAEMIGGKTGSSLTYANVEQRSLDFLTYGVSFWLKRIEDQFYNLLPAPQFVQFDTTVLLRTDAETQAKVDAIRIASKSKPPSEVRADRNEPPLTDAQKEELSLIPLTVTPSTGAAKALPNPPTPATAADAPEEPVKPRLGVVNG